MLVRVASRKTLILHTYPSPYGAAGPPPATVGCGDEDQGREAPVLFPGWGHTRGSDGALRTVATSMTKTCTSQLSCAMKITQHKGVIGDLET